MLAERHLTARLAVADTVGAAWAVSHGPAAVSHGPAAGFSIVPPGETLEWVAGLPLAALRLPPDTLALLGELGLECVEQLGRLPRSGLHGRFGPQLVRRLDQACGTVEEVIQAEHLAGQLEAEWPLEHPTDRRDVILAVLGQLLPRVIEPLASQRKGVLELVCRLECQADQPWHLPLGLFRAMLRSNICSTCCGCGWSRFGSARR